MTEKVEFSDEERADLRANRWIPWMFVFFFLVVGAVNAVFVYLAIHSHSGLVTENAYEKGLVYNQTLARAEAMKDLGWNLDVQLGDADILTARLTDRVGHPVSEAQVKGEMFRATKSGYDYDVELTEQGHSSGIYQASLVPPLRGVWTLRLLVVKDGQSFGKSEDLVLR